jgi:hypothetical protein
MLKLGRIFPFTSLGVYVLLAVSNASVKMSHVGVGCVLVVSSRHFDKMRRVERTDGDGLLLDSLTDR